MSSPLNWFQSQRQMFAAIADAFEDWLWSDPDPWQWSMDNEIAWSSLDTMLIIPQNEIDWDTGNIITY